MIKLNTVDCGTYSLSFKEELELPISYDAPMYIAEDIRYNISCSGFTINELCHEVQMQIKELWESYVEGDTISCGAARLKYLLSNTITVDKY